MLIVVNVGVALTRPPRCDKVVRVLVEADNETEASLIACQMAHCSPGVVMPVSSTVIDILEI